MRAQQVETQSTAWIRPNFSGHSVIMDQITTQLVPSHLGNSGHSQQMILQQQQQQRGSNFHNPPNIIQAGPVKPGLQNLNLSSTNPASSGFRRLLSEMHTKQFDSIRFAAYRTASKLRFIQQRTLFNIMDLWRVVETFREFGLHQLNDPQASLDYASTFRLLSRIYSHIPTTNINVNTTTNETSSSNTTNRSVIIIAAEILLGWLGYALDLCSTGRLSVNGLKITLSTLTNARPADKFRYHFTLLSDPSGALIFSKFEAYLQDLLKLPISVFEGTNFYYTPQAAQAMFVGRSKNVVLEEFLDRMLSDQGSQVLVWLTIFHRLISVANIRHNVRCEGCKREPINGLRYKCTRCPHYNLCQDCFWIGVTTDQHTNAHDVKEYSAASKSHSRQFGHSLRKSFQFGRAITNTTSSNVVTTSFTSSFSERQKFSGMNVVRRPHVGSIFEWNSDPTVPAGIVSCVNGIASAVQPSSVPINVTMGVSTGYLPGYSVSNQRFMAPVNTICSPLPNRRLQQLNPVFLATRPNTNISNFPYATSQSVQVQPAVNRSNELNQGSNSVAQNIVAVTCYTNMIQQQDMIAAEYTRAGHSIPYSEVPPDSHMSNLSGANYQPLPISCYSQPTTDVYSMGGNQQHQLTTTTTSQTTTIQSTSIVSVNNNDNLINSSMGTSFSLKMHNLDQKSNEEHNLIARYAAQLAAASALNQEFDKLGDFVESTQTQKQLIAQLQEKNRKILKEIERLRVEQQKQAAFIAAAGSLKNDSSEVQDVCDESAGTLSPTNLKQYLKSDNLLSSGVGNSLNSENPRLVADLQALRQRKDELESRMSNLQRSRTDLMLQLEVLVRLLSVSTGVANARDSDPSVLLDLSDIRQTGHNSRLNQKVSNYPPRRSTSLCQPTVGRSYQENISVESRYDETNGVHQKPGSSDNTGKIFSPLKTITVEEKGGQWNFKFPDDKKHELHSPSSILYRHSPELGPQRSSDTVVEKYKDLLYKGTSTQIGASKSLRVHFGGRRPYVGAFSVDDKTELFSHNSVNMNRLSSNHSSQHTNHSDSGSDAYLYSDPELCFTIVASTCGSSQSGVSAPQRTSQLSQFLSITPSTAKSSDKSKGFLELLTNKTITTTTIVDNYEYAGLQSSPISPLSYSSNEHIRNMRANVISNIPTTTNP
ncbi:unnamed protein product [Schistosoma turkestanicum]|nr:unnamed protein product [Schistosoma turkestanicum]